MTNTPADALGRIVMSANLAATLARAAGHANSRGHREVTIEHLLLAMIDDPDAAQILAASNVDTRRLATFVADHVEQTGGQGPSAENSQAPFSAGLRRILAAAAAAAQQGRRSEISGAIVLAAIIGDGDSAAAQFLRAQGLTFDAAIRALQIAARAAAQQPAVPASASPAAPQTPRPQESAAPGTPPPAGAGEPAEGILASARERVLSRSPAAAVPPFAARSEAPREMKADIPPFPRPDAPAEPQSRGGIGPPLPLPSELENLPAGEPFAGEPPAGPAPSSLQGNAARAAAPPPFGTPAGDTVSEPAAPPHPPVQSPPGPPPAAAVRPAGPLPRPPAAGSAPKQLGTVRTRSPVPSAATGQLLCNVPRRMRVGVAVTVDAMVAKAAVAALAGGPALPQDTKATRAIAVRLRAPRGDFWIETLSPETQWIEPLSETATSEAATWQWTIMPRSRGKKRLQFVLSVRTVGPDGLIPETALPIQEIDVRVRANLGPAVKTLFGWAVAAAAGGLLAVFGTPVWEMGAELVLKLMAEIASRTG